MFTQAISTLKQFAGGFFSGKAGNSRPLPLTHKAACPDEVKRPYFRSDVVTGQVIEHVRQGIMVRVPSGEIGMVVHAELDWSPKHGRKYFSIGTDVSVMVMTRKPDQRLYLSIKRANFHLYFQESIVDFPVGMRRMCEVVAIKDYGLFVNLKTSIDVFFHRDRLEGFDKFRIGDLVEIEVTGYDMERSRIVANLL